MKKKYTDFIPKSDAEFARWLQNLLKRFPELATICLSYLSNAEIASFLNAGNEVLQLIFEVPKAKASLKGLVSHKEATKRKFIKMARAYIVCAKASNNFSMQLAAGAGILSSSQTIDINNIRPEIKVTARTGYVEIIFNKHHVLPVAIFCRLEGDYDWHFVGNEDTSPFLDKTPLQEEFKPERREYMARYTNIKHLIGQESAISVVTCG